MFNFHGKHSSGRTTLGELSGRRSLEGMIGGKHKSELFQFSLANRSSVAFALTQLKADANLQLLSTDRTQLAASAKPGKQSEQVALTLAPGTYYLRVSGGGKAGTRYTLTTTQSPAGTSTPSAYLPGRSPDDYGLLVLQASDAASTFYTLGTPSAYEKFNGINNLLYGWAIQGDQQAAYAYAAALKLENDAFAISLIG